MKKIFTFLLIVCFSATLFSQTDSLEVPRYVLVEGFSSSTCPPCNAGNVNLKNVLTQHADNGGKHTLIKYQMSWPGNGDPYYTTEGNTKRNLYGVNSVPWVIINGVKRDVTLTNIKNAEDVPSYVKVSGNYYIAGQTIGATINVEPTMNISGGNSLRLYVAIVEKVTNNNWKTTPNQSNGERVFYQIMKKFMPNASGIILGDIEANQIITHELSWEFIGDYRLPVNATKPINHNIEHSVEDFDNLEVVAWVQNTSTKEVYNSGTAEKVEVVVFNVNNEIGGTLTATANGVPITSGSTMKPGDIVEFVAEPTEKNYKYYVKEWIHNGEIVPDNTSYNYSFVFEKSAIVTVVFARDYNLNFEVTNGNGTLSASMDGNPVNSGDEIFVGKSIEFSATPNDGYFVKEWKHNDVAVAGNTTQNLTITVSGDETVAVEFEEKEEGVNMNDFSNVELFPNPVTNELIINNAEQIQRVIISNTLGQIVNEENLTGKSTVVISTQNLQSGIFFITLKNFEGNEITKKIVKQ